MDAAVATDGGAGAVGAAWEGAVAAGGGVVGVGAGPALAHRRKFGEDAAASACAGDGVRDGGGAAMSGICKGGADDHGCFSMAPNPPLPAVNVGAGWGATGVRGWSPPYSEGGSDIPACVCRSPPDS